MDAMCRLAISSLMLVRRCVVAVARRRPLFTLSIVSLAAFKLRLVTTDCVNACACGGRKMLYFYPFLLNKNDLL